MTWEGHAQHVRDALLAKHEAGVRIRELEEEPLLTPELASVLAGFSELGTMRPPAFSGVLPIPFDRMNAWLDENQITDTEQREDLRFLWQSLDNAYLASVSKKQPKTPESPKGKETS